MGTGELSVQVRYRWQFRGVVAAWLGDATHGAAIVLIAVIAIAVDDDYGDAEGIHC